MGIVSLADSTLYHMPSLTETSGTKTPPRRSTVIDLRTTADLYIHPLALRTGLEGG